MNIVQFHEPMWIIVGCLILGVFFIVHQKLPTKQNFLHTHILKKIQKRNSLWGYIFWLQTYLIFMCVCILLSGLHSNVEKIELQKNGIDIAVVMDLSYSMLASDLPPNRLEVAKDVSQDFMSQMDSDRVSMVLFAGIPFLAVPLTYEYDFLEKYIEQMSIETIKQDQNAFMGTATGDAMILASDVLTSHEALREKVMILITDGEANKGLAVEEALRFVKDAGIKVYTIGVGKPGPAIVDVKLPNGIIQKTRIGGIDEVLLQKIAQETKGRFFAADDAQAFKQAMQEIAQLEKRESTIETVSYKQDGSFWMSCILLVLCVLQMGIIFFRRIRLW